MERVQGRPENCDGRLLKEVRVYDFLDGLDISYQRIDHDHCDTMEQLVVVGQMLEAPICKNLMLCNRQKTDFYLLLMPGDKPFKTKDLSAQIGSSRLSFADSCFMEEFLDITSGSLSVLGLMNDKDHRVRLLIDEDVLKEEFVGVHPCINTSTLRLRTQDLLQKIIPAMKHDPTVVHL